MEEEQETISEIQSTKPLQDIDFISKLPTPPTIQKNIPVSPLNKQMQQSTTTDITSMLSAEHPVNPSTAMSPSFSLPAKQKGFTPSRSTQEPSFSRPSFGSSSTITRRGKTQPLKRARPTESGRSTGLSGFRSAGYTGSSYSPSYTEPNYSFGTPTAEEKLSIPFGQMKISKQEALAGAEGPVFTQEEIAPEKIEEKEAEEETWTPLPKKQKQTKIVEPEAKSVKIEETGWFERLITRIIEYVKYLFGK